MTPVTVFALRTPKWRTPAHSSEHYNNTANLPTKHIHKFLILNISNMKSVSIRLCSFHPNLSHLHKWHHHPSLCSTYLAVILNPSLLPTPRLQYKIHHQALSALFSKYIYLHCYNLHPGYYQLFPELLRYLPKCSPYFLFLFPRYNLNITARMVLSKQKTDQVIPLLTTHQWFLSTFNMATRPCMIWPLPTSPIVSSTNIRILFILFTIVSATCNIHICLNNQ